MTQPQIFRLPKDSTQAQIVQALREHGHVVLEHYATELVAQAADELAPYLLGAPTGTGEFTGTRTQRVNRLIARSAACRAIASDARIVGAVSELFQGSCYFPQLALTQCIAIHPGESPQGLHRDDNAFFLRHPRPPAVINTMWALEDFTEDNGATRLIPGSHLWDDQQPAEESQTLPATMPKGSVLLWDGGLYHGGGGNRSSSVRTGMILAYNLGWLRQYENMYLSVPPEVAATLSLELQKLIGYSNHGYLGTFEGNDPRVWLQDPDAPPHPAPDLFTSELEQVQRLRM